jgi:hypothetical protein
LSAPLNCLATLMAKQIYAIGLRGVAEAMRTFMVKLAAAR